jgi:hypothetical protein
VTTDTKAERTAVMSRAVLEAVDAAHRALEAIDLALITGNQLGVAVFGWPELEACKGPLRTLIHSQGRATFMSRHVLDTLDPGPGGDTA